MNQPAKSNPMPDRLTSFFWSGEIIRSRRVSSTVLHGRLNVPVLPTRLTADCDREMSRLGLEIGDVEVLSLVRARARWPNYGSCVQAVSAWVRSFGLSDVLASSEIAFMGCRGARYHHDGVQYGGAAFCNLFLSEDKDLDVHFPSTGLRIPLCRGTAMVFDTCQPHAVIPRGSRGFNAADFSPDRDISLLFLTWELPIEDISVAEALRVALDVDPVIALQQREAQVWLQDELGGARASVRPDSGRWCRRD